MAVPSNNIRPNNLLSAILFPLNFTAEVASCSTLKNGQKSRFLPKKLLLVRESNEYMSLLVHSYYTWKIQQKYHIIQCLLVIETIIKNKGVWTCQF